MDILFLMLLTAHLIGDFVLQSDWLVKAKEKWPWLLVHCFILSVTAFAVVGAWRWELYAILFMSHFLIDAAKFRLRQLGLREIYSFLFDQGGHIVIFAFLAGLFEKAVNTSFWGEYYGFYLPFLVIFGGLILCMKVGDVVISMLVKPFLEEIGDQSTKGLKNGGKWIGQLERLLGFMLILGGQTAAIGFLFAAKSILRFGEIKNTEQRKEAEYIIIGTFMSFGWAIWVSILTRWALRLV